MSEIKQCLKDAKNSLANEDYEDAIRESKRVLKLDSENYFAYVFLGKAYSCLNELRLSKESYQEAIAIQPNNNLAWKGLFMLLKNADVIPTIVSFDEYFDLCGQYAEILSQLELPQIELINDIRDFRSRYKDSQESFLRHMQPGTDMAERLSRHLISPQEALEGLLNILSARELQQVSKVVSRERLKISANDPDYNLKINTLAWQIFKDSELDDLYQQLINVTDDDLHRRELESKWLEYRIKVLKSMPADLKPQFFNKMRTMVTDMIVIEHNSLLAWQFFFEWHDYSDLNSIDPNVISKFLKKFPKEPLAVILYAWVCSDFSLYNAKEFCEKTFNDQDSNESNSTKNILDAVTDDIDEEEKDELKKLVDPSVEETEYGLSEDEVLVALTDNIKKTQQSILAHRIVSHYYLASREYEYALPYIKAGISLVIHNVKNLGAQLSNSKKELTLDLATAYTYFEAPKNHATALSLFEKLLSENPDNVDAKMGKGLIYIERKNWEEAFELLSEVSKYNPANLEVLSELGWSQLHLNDTDSAIEKFKYVLNNLTGTDMPILDFRALNHWRMAVSYIKKSENEGAACEELIKSAFKQLVQAIKISETFSASYSTLGDLYAQNYNDPTRAFKCYFRAFELDPSDLNAAKYMCEKYSQTGNWQQAGLIAERVVKTEKAKSALQKSNWPFRVMGVACLEKESEASSIEWFQSALRVEPLDVESWIGLGQAYYACGRIEASMKVFEKAILLQSDNTHAHYFKALSLAKLGEYTESISIFKQLVKTQPQEECFQVSMVEVMVEYCNMLCSRGFLSKSVSEAAEAITRIEHIITGMSSQTPNLWIALSRALRLFITIQSQVHLLPLESLVNIFEGFELQYTEEINETDDIELSSLLSDDGEDNVAIATKFLILSGKYAIASSDYKNLSRTIRASLWYNLGTIELLGYTTLKSSKYRDASILCFKKSIEFQSNTAEAWIGFGIASIDLNYRVAQHCFIKAAALSPKEISVWYDLAVLALKNNDVEFAREVLTKSQSIAPQDSSPWLGMALTLEKDGQYEESSQLFAHSFVVSNGKSKAAQLLYAKSILTKLVGKGHDERDIAPSQELTAVACGLDEYLKKSPDDTFAIQCAVLTLERLHNFGVAHKLTDRLSKILEKRFEKTQNEAELFNFAIIKSQIARVSLGLRKFDTAVENAELSQGILDEYNNEDARRATISNHVVVGLSSFFLDDLDQTLDQFKTVLDKSGESKQLVILIAKILYNIGTEETQEIALRELVQYMTEHTTDLMVILTIASISLLENKKSDLQAILSELVGLPITAIIEDKHRDVPYLIEEINKKLSEKEKCHDQWQRTAFFFPNDCNSWGSLSKKIRARVCADSQNRITASRMSDYYSSLGKVSRIQRALFLCPWNLSAVKSLRQCY
ncbi:LAFE_0H17546g1_1 [Lachancea fermentati]|uniref:LAFE_0H17546g1_1 n=1 Tax=Lachancea fermentati TaxID=4955 RepID=A0A1G4ML94_LACFM|nr:LAFE_0H17546g1_1 [Lachancea fermentati]